MRVSVKKSMSSLQIGFNVPSKDSKYKTLIRAALSKCQFTSERWSWWVSEFAVLSDNPCITLRVFTVKKWKLPQTFMLLRKVFPERTYRSSFPCLVWRRYNVNDSAETTRWFHEICIRDVLRCRELIETVDWPSWSTAEQHVPMPSS